MAKKKQPPAPPVSRTIQIVVSESDYREILSAALEQSRLQSLLTSERVPVSLSAYCAERVLGRPSQRPWGRPRKEAEPDA